MLPGRLLLLYSSRTETNAQSCCFLARLFCETKEKGNKTLQNQTCIFSICNICKNILGMHNMQKHTKYATYAITYKHMQNMQNIPNMQHMQKHPTFAIYAKIYQKCKICIKIPKNAINRPNMQNHTMEPLAVTQRQ